MAKLNTIANFQIGKNGLTESSIHTLEILLKSHKQVRISFLKASGRTRETMSSLLNEIISKIQTPVYSRIIGFTIILNKKSSLKP